MKNFLIILTYKVELAIVEQHTDAHREYLRTLYGSKDLLMSGPFVPRTAGVLWAQAMDRSRIDEMIAADPFNREGVANYEVHEFKPVMFSEHLKGLFAEQNPS